MTSEFCQRGATVDTPFLTDLKTQTSPIERLVMLHIVLVLRLRSPGYEPCLWTSGLFCALPRFANQARFSLFSLPEGRERSRRSSLNGRRLHFVAIGHFSHFGARFPVFGAVRPSASVRDRLTTSVCSGFWHIPYLLPFEGHCGPRDQLRG